MSNKTPNLEAFNEKIAAFFDTHQKIIAEFRISMENSQNFLELAKLSAEREPENTVDMLEQIKEIDLFGHLSRQFDVFQEVAGAIPKNSEDPNIQLQLEKFEDFEKQYEDLLEEAESQLELLEQLLAQLIGNA